MKNNLKIVLKLSLFIFSNILYSSDNKNSIETVKELNSNNGSITALNISKDEKYIVVGSNSLIQVFSIEGNLLKEIYHAHNGTINDLKFSYDSKFLASSSSDKTIKIWDCQENFIQEKIFKSYLKEYCTIEFYPTYYLLSFANAEGTIKYWNIINNDCHIEHMTRPINVMTFSNNKKYLAIGMNKTLFGMEKLRIINLYKSFEKKLLYDYEDWCVNSLKFYKDTDCLICLASNPNSSTIVSEILKIMVNYDNENQIEIVNRIKETELTDTFDIISENLIIAGYKNGKIKILNFETGNSLFTWQAHNYKINKICYLPINELIISTDVEGNIFIWKIPNIN